MKSILIAAISAALLSTSSVSWADLIAEEILPENTLAVLNIKNKEQPCAQFKQINSLLKDPAMEPFVSYVWELAKIYCNETKQFLSSRGIELQEYKNFFSGSFAIAVTDIQHISDTDIPGIKMPNGKTMSGIPLLLVETKENSEEIKNKLDNLIQKISDIVPNNQLKIATAKIETLEFYQLSHVNRPGSLWIGVIPRENQPALLAFTLSELKCSEQSNQFTLQSLNRIFIQNNVPKLAQNKNFSEFHEILPEKDYFWLNFSPANDFLKELFIEKDKKYTPPEDVIESLMAPARPIVIYQELGTEAFKSLAITGNINSKGSLSFQYTLLAPESERRGISALLNGIIHGDCSPIEQAPADIINFKRVRLDPQIIWNTIDITTSRILGGTKAIIMGALKSTLLSQNPEINLKNNILDNLTGDFIFWNTPIIKDEKGLLSSEQVALIGIKNSEILLKIIRSILDLNKIPVEEQEIAGIKVYTITIKVDTQPEKSFLPQKICLAAVENYLICSSGNTEIIQKYLSPGREIRLPGRRDIINASKQISEKERGYFEIIDQRSVGKSFSTLIQSKNLLNQIENPQIKKAIELLPPFSEIEKYFGITIKTLTRTPEGLRCTAIHSFPTEIE